MRLSYLDNEDGLTLIELIVTLGLSGLVLLLVVTGSLFVQKFISDWSARDKVTEELAFLSRELTPAIEASREVQTRGDTLLFVGRDLDSTLYTLVGGGLCRRGHRLSRTGLLVVTASIDAVDLHNWAEIDTLSQEKGPRGLYRLKLVVSDQRGNRDSLLTIVRNDYEYFKYSQ